MDLIELQNDKSFEHLDYLYGLVIEVCPNNLLRISVGDNIIISVSRNKVHKWITTSVPAPANKKASKMSPPKKPTRLPKLSGIDAECATLVTKNKPKAAQKSSQESGLKIPVLRCNCTRAGWHASFCCCKVHNYTSDSRYLHINCFSGSSNNNHQKKKKKKRIQSDHKRERTSYLESSGPASPNSKLRGAPAKRRVPPRKRQQTDSLPRKTARKSTISGSGVKTLRSHFY